MNCPKWNVCHPRNMGRSPFSGFGYLGFKLQKHILGVLSTVPNVKINFLTIGPGLGTKKPQKQYFFKNNFYFFVMGTAKSEVSKVNPSHERILGAAEGS
jgi:hypothetical protein